MTCIDRYILRVYLRTLGVCFLSLAGIFVVFHAFTNMEDLHQYAQVTGGMFWAVVSYYVPYLFMLFEMTGMIVALMALLFTMGLMRRSGELTAMLAAGVSHGRIVRPMLLAAAVVLGLAAVNRELVLPRWQDQLGIKVKDIDDQGGERPLLPVYDRVHGVLLDGKALRLAQESIVQPLLKIHFEAPQFGRQINAKLATWKAKNAVGESGYLLDGVESPKQIDQIPSVVSEHGAEIRTAMDTEWLEPGQCFVSSEVPVDFLQAGSGWMRMATTFELIRRVSNPAVYCPTDVRVTLHDRWLRPFLDMSLIVLSLSLVVGHGDRNMFVVTGHAMGLVLLFFALRTLFHMMGGNGYLVDPATAAWIPLIILAPAAYARYRVVQVS